MRGSMGLSRNQLRVLVPLFVLAVVSGGCSSSSSVRVGNSAAAMGERSPTLVRALADVIDDAVRDHASRFGRVPQLSGRGDEVERLADELDDRYPSVLHATAAEEERLRTGRIDYGSRMRTMRAIAGRVEDEQVTLPIVSAYLLQQYHRGQLVGVRLELAARLLEAQINDPRFSES